MGAWAVCESSERIENEENKSNIKEHINNDLFIKFEDALKLTKYVCKIFYEYNQNFYSGTGFFILLTNNMKFLITNYHIIS